MTSGPNGERGAGTGAGWSRVLLPAVLIGGLVALLALDGGVGEGSAAENPLEATLAVLVGYLASGAEIAAAVVIGIAVVVALVRYLGGLVAGRDQADVTERVRLGLGRALALGLEFTVASDILRTAVAPTRQDLLTLAALVLLRTLLNFFLEREIREVEERRSAGA